MAKSYQSNRSNRHSRPVHQSRPARRQYTGEVDEGAHTKVSVMVGDQEVLLWVRIEGERSNHNSGRGTLVDTHPKLPDLKPGQVLYYHGGDRYNRPVITGRAHVRNKLTDLKAEVATNLAECMMGNTLRA